LTFRFKREKVPSSKERERERERERRERDEKSKASKEDDGAFELDAAAARYTRLHGMGRIPEMGRKKVGRKGVFIHSYSCVIFGFLLTIASLHCIAWVYMLHFWDNWYTAPKTKV
jgi:hypothetical protein